jgi:hypothetical protein
VTIMRYRTLANTRENRTIANDLVDPALNETKIELTTTDGLTLLLTGARSNAHDGRIVAQLTIAASSKNDRRDLTTMDGCTVDFAASTAVSARAAFNCRVFAPDGAIGCLRIPGIRDFRWLAP